MVAYYITVHLTNFEYDHVNDIYHVCCVAASRYIINHVMYVCLFDDRYF